MSVQRPLKKPNKFPHQPGVYLMKDRHQRVLYIGKARDLRQRVSHYSAPRRNIGDLDPKTHTLLSRVKKIEYLTTDSEMDALFLEARLVRDIKPKYNVNLKDDKTFPLLAIGRTDDFPRVFITRARGKPDLTYYGPFTNAGDLRSAFKSLQRIFKFRTCRRKIAPPTPSVPSNRSRPCLLYHIKQCVAPCIGRVSKKDYQDLIRSLEEFLGGDKDKLINRLTEAMHQASQQQDFERASSYRAQVNGLKGIAGEGKMAEFYEGALAAITPSQRMRYLQKLLKLPQPPRRIEGLDISDIKGREAVGAIVCFIDGEPFKGGYRRYKIKTVTEGEPDDYQRMAEVVRRRFRPGDTLTDDMPDILLIDGGPGHLSVVAQVFQELGISPPEVLALAKYEGDHLYRLGKAKPLALSSEASGFHFLQYVRDEAHRFARRYHHYLRRKQLYY